METWPAQFQELLNQESFGITFGDTTVRSDMEVGLNKVRSRYTDGIDVVTCTITIDISLYETLTEFFKTTLGNGTRTFEFDHPMTGDPAEWRFKSPPDIRPIGGRHFNVNMNWELMP